ncbi:hypothetical protein MBLNU457_4412t1 [Dothideomycetes sp. NU457]
MSTGSEAVSPDSPSQDGEDPSSPSAPPVATQHSTLKYHLLGPSLTKAGQDSVDQKKVSEIIYNASKGSKYFNNEENKDKILTQKINQTLARKRQLEKLDLKHDLRKADEYIAQLELSRDLSQSIVHIDCDAFYAAVEELERPELRDVPFAVGKGVLTTCNYQARKFGCRSGMAGFVADKLCPQLIHVSPSFEKYVAKAKEVRAVLEQYDPRFESASVDEAYLNMTAYCKEHDMTPEAAVQQMRDEVHEKCKITISAGIASNTKLAKIGSNMNKPNGQFRLQPDRTSIMTFMRDLPTRKVNGVGRVLERELDAIGVKTCGDIYGQRQYLSKLFGEKAFEFLMGVYLGLGRTEVRPAEEHERKSVGTESSFHDMKDPKELREKLRWLAEELEKDCERTQFKGRTLVLKIKLHTYEVFTRQHAPPKAVHTADDLYKYALPMLTKLESEMPGLTLRLMGIRITHLVSMKKGSVDFFGRRPGASLTKKYSTGQEEHWEQWPDEEFEAAAQQERQDDLDELEKLSQEVAHDSPAPKSEERIAFEARKHDNGFAWRLLLEEERNAAQKAQAAADAENASAKPAEKQSQSQWDCPICSLPQPADDHAFNQHIDSCLSRQTIKEIVRTASSSPQPAVQPQQQQGKKRGRPSAAAKDAESKRPKHLFFA